MEICSSSGAVLSRAPTTLLGGNAALATELVFGRFERKPDAKAGAIRLGGKIDFSAMTLDNDSVADNQSEAGSRATLGGEERDGKNMRLGFRRNAAAVIGDFDEEVGTVTPGLNVDSSSSVHRIDGIVMRLVHT